MLNKLIAMCGTILFVGLALGIIVLVLSFFCGVIILGLKVAVFIIAFAVITSLIKKVIDRFR